MKILISSEIPHRIIEYELTSQDEMTELGQILFVNCCWGKRDLAEAIATYLFSLGYKKETHETT